MSDYKNELETIAMQIGNISRFCDSLRVNSNGRIGAINLPVYTGDAKDFKEREVTALERIATSLEQIVDMKIVLQEVNEKLDKIPTK